MKKIIIEVLMHELWHFKNARNKWDKEIQMHGPEDNICKFYNEANEGVERFEKAISLINKILPDNY